MLSVPECVHCETAAFLLRNCAVCTAAANSSRLLEVTTQPGFFLETVEVVVFRPGEVVVVVVAALMTAATFDFRVTGLMG